MPVENTIALPALGQLLSAGSSKKDLSLSSVLEQASEALQDFAQLAMQQLEEHNISIPPAISLISRQPHSIQLENQHPHVVAIQAWLKDNTLITKRFKELEVLYELVNAAENAGTKLADHTCFHIGLTSAGPIAYFE